MGLTILVNGSTRIPLVLGIFLIFVSLYFFSMGVTLVSNDDVASGLLAALIGFALLATSITLIKLWGLMKIKGNE